MRTKNFTRFLPLLLLMIFFIGGGKISAQGFYESFDKNESVGGNDGKWNNIDPKGNIVCDNDGWSFTEGHSASKCAKFGAGSKSGSATTPAIPMSGDLVLTFKAGAWNAKSEKQDLLITLEGKGSLDKKSIEMSKGAWGEYTVNISGAEAGFKIKFAAKETSKNRFFLDEVRISENGTPSIPSPNLSFTEATKTVDLSDGAFTYAVTNPNNVPVTYSSSNEGVATVDNNGQVTPKTAGATTISAEFAGSDKFSAQTAKYELTVTDKANAYTLSTIKNVITETEGTYSLKFDNAVISYVNGKNAYIEDKNGAILFYAENAYQAGEVFNGVATVKAKDYNGTKELTSIDITPTTGGTIPLTTVTAEELSKNIAQYEYRRVKIVGATLATAFTDRKANIEQKGTTIELFNKNTKIEKELKKIADGSTLDVIGFAGTYNGKAQLNVWETSDITEANTLPSPELSFAEATKTVDLSEGSFTNALKNDNGVAVTYSSSDEKVATVDQSGKVTPLAAGTTTISAAFAGNETYKAQTVSYELTVKDKSVATGTIDEITAATINNTNSSYDNVENITVGNGSGAVYAANTYGYNKKCIQIKNKGDVSGLVTTASAGKVKSVTITWNSETKNGRKLNIYGKNTAYSLASDLYNKSSQGKSLGSLIKKAGSATSTLNINEDIAYVGICSDEYTLYIDKITIEWDNGNSPSSSVTFSTNAQDQSDNYCYGTVYSDKALKLPTEVIGSTIKYVNGKLQMDWEYDSDKTVPAGTPILVMSENKGNHTAAVVADDKQEAPADNVLKGSATDKEVSDPNSYFYILTFSFENNAKTLGFYWQNETGHSISTKGGKAYLQLPAEASLSAVKGFSISKGSVTSIGSIKQDNAKAATIYTISGVKVNAPVNSLPKGIYIVDGKKVMVK